MASPATSGGSQSRPAATRISSRPLRPESNDIEPAKLLRRAHTVPEGIATISATKTTDAFETAESSETDEEETNPVRTSVELDDLPIELVAMTDSFIESLGAKVHSTPPNIEKLSQLFQDFYFIASSHIATHVGVLATKQSREVSPAPSISSISSATSRLRSNISSISAKEPPRADSGRQMITAGELAEKKKAKRALLVKRTLLEEAVERRLCEGIYERIYRHRSTQDQAHDDKLRSKTAALAVVGISPADLGVDLGPAVSRDESHEITDRLAQARKDLVQMHESRYPLGKLNCLKAAHRSIVDTVAHYQPSASADEIMPMLIFTLVSLSPENVHVISDIHFIQSFRWEPKLTGEAAYCLTNLEAAISFLQTVDLATLRADEQPSGPPKTSSRSGTPKTETFPPAYSQSLTPIKDSIASTGSGATTQARRPGDAGLKPASGRGSRRLSDLVNTPAQAFGAASDAVISTADQSLKNITNSLGDSYNFLLGKMRERQEGPRESIAVPRTLDEARKLVTAAPLEEDESLLAASSNIDYEDTGKMQRALSREQKLLGLMGGRRDRSADSAVSGRSTGSAPKPFILEDTKLGTSTPSGQNPAVLDQMRNLGNSLNPMARLSSIGGFRGFGRGPSTSISTPSAVAKDNVKPADGGDLATAFPDIAAALPTKKIGKIAPPIKRFMELQSPGDLKLSEVLELLRDYRRLAGALKEHGAFEEK